MRDVQEEFDAYRKQHGLPTFKLNKGQLVMAQDGFPLYCFMTPEERSAAWEKHPPVAYSFVDPKRQELKELPPEAVAFLKAEEEKVKLKSASRIAKMKVKLETKTIDFNVMRWNPMRARFEPIDKSQTQESTMRIKFSAFDAGGKYVQRASTSLPEPATEEQINDKVKFCFKRGGAAIKTISVSNADGTQHSAWEKDNGVPQRNDSVYKTPVSVSMGNATPKANNKAKAAKPSKPAAAKAPKKKPAAAASDKRTRSAITADALSNWVSAEELAAKFKDELGNGKLTTARLALHKIPKAANRRVDTKKDPERGLLYRWAK